MAEDLTDYLREAGIKVRYLHSDIDTLERVEIIRDLRLGVFDVLVGINLLREGLDLPEVSFIGDPRRRQGGVPARLPLADPDHRTRGAQRLRPRHHVRRSDVGRDGAGDRRDGPAPRHPGRVQRSSTTSRRCRSSRPCTRWSRIATSSHSAPRRSRRRPGCRPDEVLRLAKDVEKEMLRAARDLEFERAAELRDRLVELRRRIEGEEEPEPAQTHRGRGVRSTRASRRLAVTREHTRLTGRTSVR